MPSPRAVLADIHDNDLDPTKEHKIYRLTKRLGQEQKPVENIDVVVSSKEEENVDEIQIEFSDALDVSESEQKKSKKQKKNKQEE